MKLDRWVQHGNCLVGYIFDDKTHPAGTRVVTKAIRFIDPINRVAECLDGEYKLLTPGTYEEHDQPLLGRPKDSEPGLVKLDSGIYLNPNG